MLLRENYTAEHIAKLRQETGADPSILERTVFAFGLLEAIRSVDMPFIFKGGTSLLVLLNEPRRLSTDIDIIVDHETDVDSYIEKAGRIFPLSLLYYYGLINALRKCMLDEKYSAEDVIKLTKNIYKVRLGENNEYKVSAVQKKSRELLEALKVDLLRDNLCFSDVYQ